MPCLRTPPGGRRGVRAAVAALLVAAGGCDLGSDRLACTLDPAALVVSVTSSSGCSVDLGGGAFQDGASCGVACPRPWTVTVRWTNRTTGASGAQALAWVPGGSCWPFSNHSCALSGFALQVPVVTGTNDLLLEADEGDGFTACQRLEATGPPGC